MIARVLLAAIAAGLIAGAVVSMVQMYKVVPLIYAAESYEQAAPEAHSHGHDNSAGEAHHHDDEAWAPSDGFERIAYTTLTNVLVGTGFGLLLAAGMTLRGRRTDWRIGVVWGGGGFLAFSLLPALGLPPELPGMAAADLGGRQAWWLMAVVGSAAGLSLIAFAPTWILRVAGMIVIVLPHVAGAPHPHDLGGNVPAELAAQFVSASLVTAGLFWLALGGLTGHFIGRTTDPEAA